MRTAGSMNHDACGDHGHHDDDCHDPDGDDDYVLPAVDFRDLVLAWNPVLMAETVLDAPHCWQRRNMIRVPESLSSSVSGDLQLLHRTYSFM
mmetsp:Transcript_5452/g.15501  ORF Transcript_5452/g.15501 Transcript_5452/m.15501 type:complete len:92 (+) Transcript_5452:73-348(+)